MPTIAWFYGIAIRMYCNDHNPPHFHAPYGRAKAILRISDGEIIAGRLPPTAARLLKDWAIARQQELEHNWKCGRTTRPMQKIAGPDGDD
jgi:hypothetical protein